MVIVVMPFPGLSAADYTGGRRRQHPFSPAPFGAGWRRSAGFLKMSGPFE
jgi:hypothetical protein